MWALCYYNQCDIAEYVKAQQEAASLQRQYKTSVRE